MPIYLREGYRYFSIATNEFDYVDKSTIEGETTVALKLLWWYTCWCISSHWCSQTLLLINSIDNTPVMRRRKA